MNESCRLCLRVQARVHLTSIFGKGENLERLRSRILDCCPITLFEHDRLPKAICDQCRRKLAIAYDFREQCRKSERALRTRYQSCYWNESNRFASKTVVVRNHIADHSKDEQRVEEKEAEEDLDADADADADAKEGDGERVGESLSRIGEKKVEGRREERSADEVEEYRQDRRISVEWASSKRSIGGETLKGQGKGKGEGKEEGDGAKRYLCDVCSKTFLSKSGLRFHLKSHNGAKPHQCRHCGKRFVIPSYAKRHERIHAAEKRFVCHVCSASFASSNGFKYHLRSHTGEANYRCEVCGKSFNRSKYLREHAYTHTGERPFACRTCGSCYGNSGSLYVHEKRCIARNDDNGGDTDVE